MALAGCEQAPEPVAEAPVRWKAPTPVGIAAQVVAADAAALVGNQPGAEAKMHAAQDSFRRSMKLADPTRRVDQELARSAAKRVDGVRSAVWIDRENLLVIVEENGQKSQQTIDAICTQLDPLGDTLGVVLNVQSGAATTGDELEILSRNCQLEPGDRAYLQRNRQVDVLSPAIRAQHKANQERKSD
jgi:hypothetical protein